MEICFYFGLSAPPETSLAFHQNPDGDCSGDLLPPLEVDWPALARLDMRAVDRCLAEWESERLAGLLHTDARPYAAYEVRVAEEWVRAVFLDRDTLRLEPTRGTVHVDDVQWRLAT